MTAPLFSIIVFVVAFGATLLGLRIRRLLPAAYGEESISSSVRAIISQMAILTTVVLGFVTATAKSDFDLASSLVADAASRIVTLDRILAELGDRAADLRRDLRGIVEQQIESIDSWHDLPISNAAIIARAQRYEDFHRRLAMLEPRSEAETDEIRRAHSLMADVMRSRWVFSLDPTAELPWAFLLFVAVWLAITFFYVGLFAADNAFVILTAACVAMCLASAMFLILELEGPTHGFVRVSAAPLERALAILGK